MNRKYKAAMQKHNRRAYRRALRWRYVLVVTMVSQILIAVVLVAIMAGAIAGPFTAVLVPVSLLLLVGFYALHAYVAKNLSFEEDRDLVRRRLGF